MIDETSADYIFARSMGMTINEVFPLSLLSNFFLVLHHTLSSLRLGFLKFKVNAAIGKLQEVNPMLGFRGCRLGVAYPELVEMQARAVAEAAINNKKV